LLLNLPPTWLGVFIEQKDSCDMHIDLFVFCMSKHPDRRLASCRYNLFIRISANMMVVTILFLPLEGTLAPMTSGESLI
jgi:hypothetical protein